MTAAGCESLMLLDLIKEMQNEEARRALMSELTTAWLVHKETPAELGGAAAAGVSLMTTVFILATEAA